MPLAAGYFIVNWFAENMAILKEVLIVVMCCEAVAIVINPFPKWCFENNINGLVEIGDKIFHREAPTEEGE